MLISVTFSQLRQHLEHLDRELQLAEKIKDLLKQQSALEHGGRDNITAIVCILR